MEHFNRSESQIAFRGSEIKENACNCTQDTFFYLLVLAEAATLIQQAATILSPL